MTAPIIDLTESQIIGALGDFLTSVVSAGTVVLLGQANFAPEPNADDFVIMWPIFRGRMAYNIDTFAYVSAPTTTQSEADMKVIYQVDVHGPNSGNNAQVIATLWNDDYASTFFDAKGYPLRPLYMADGQQLPFVNAEQQNEFRYVLKAEMQGNFTTSTTQQFAANVAIGLISVDATYPPGA